MVLLNGRIELLVVEAKLASSFDADKCNPFCIVNASGKNGAFRIGKTSVINHFLNPVWNYKVVADLKQDVTKLKFILKDKNLVKSDTIGTCFIETSMFTGATKHYKGLLPITDSKEQNVGSIKVEMWYTGTRTYHQNESSLTEKVKVTTGDMLTKVKDSSSSFRSNKPKQSMFLHGVLEIKIRKATNLSNLDLSLLDSFRKKEKNVSDPYVTIMAEDSKREFWKVGTSSIAYNNLNPLWNEKFNVNVCHEIVCLKFIIKDRDIMTAKEIGTLKFQIKDVKSNLIDGEYDLKLKKESKKKSKLSISIKFTPSQEEQVLLEVPECFFPMRELSKIILYQDAHCIRPSTHIEDLTTNNSYQRAWLDIYHTITDAKEFIFILGWSINVKQPLLRWKHEDNRCIGDILLYKANEGVNVCIMVWNDFTSTELNKEGAMGTNDEETVKFFKNTSVKVVPACRERHSKKTFSSKEHFTNFCYSHHQKCLLVDGRIESETRRQVVAYIGGLDFANGRFDTPEHLLFGTLDSDHKFDFYNNICEANAKYGPRMPWHDIHCRIEGPASLDLLINFQERWRKQGGKLKNHGEIDVGKYHYSVRIPFRWHTQIFRSINSDSADFHIGNPPGLFVNKERIYENSIHRAYIYHIRRSKKFVYIENQYFMGSSHAWNDCRDANIKNLIPLEIAIHIEEKIKAGERFTAYILIPMFPEGKPTDRVIQEMLHWQFRTIEMMYGRIADAIIEAQIDAHPQDYLLFFCLGKKEGGFSVAPSELTGHAVRAFKHRRLMIYVHSKMAIFDDEYIIVGSANINDRSMDGNRDTEVAMGAYQPQFLVHDSVLPEGDVAAFRKSLWAEHLGDKYPLVEDPSTLSCAIKIKELAEEGLIAFLAQGDSPGVRHLLIYPLEVRKDGSVVARKDCPTFPDTKASVYGCRSSHVPSQLTS